MTNRTLQQGTGPSQTARTPVGVLPRAGTVTARLLTVLVAAAALLWWTVAAPAATAHNVLISSDPADGATLPEPPAAVTLEFNDRVLDIGAEFQVTGPQGQVDLGAPVIDGVRISQPLPEGLPAGDYSVIWRVTSADGHPIDGTLAFTATSGAAAADPAPEPDATTAPAEDPDPTTAPTDSDADADSDGDSATAVPISAPSDGVGVGVWLALAAVVVVVVVVAALWWTRRRATTAD